MLRLRFEQIAPADPPDSYDPTYRFSLVSEDGASTVVFEAALVGEEFVNWFLAHDEAIRTESAVFSVEPSESLPGAFWRAWDELPEWDVDGAPEDVKDPDDPRREELFGYRERHSSVFAAEGMAFPEFFFGIGSEGPEFSCIGAPRSLEPQPWSGPEWTWRHHPIDYDEFFGWLRQEYPDAPYPEPEWLEDEE